MERASRPSLMFHATRLLAVVALFSACAIHDVPAGTDSCEYRCVSVCPPGFVCRDGYCVRPEFTSTCTPDEDAAEATRGAASSCRPGDGHLTLSALSSLQACTGQEVQVSLEVTGGDGPFQWFATSLAPDLVLEQNATRRALLRGVLRDVGSFEVTVGVRDARNCAQFSLPVAVAETPVVKTAWPPVCVGTPFELELMAEGGDPSSYTWTYEGSAPLEQTGSTLQGRTPSEPGGYAVRLTLRDAHCPIAGADAVTLDDVWTVRAPGECPRIITTGLPAPCQGVAYSQALLASDGSGTGYLWSAVSSQLPSGLRFDAERGLVQGTPTGVTRTGSLELLLRDSQGQRATATLDLSLRDDCAMAWIADEPARLYIGDVFLSNGALALPSELDPGARVLDMRFSPDGAWLAFRAGTPGDEHLHLYSMMNARSGAAVALDFVCPDALACVVLDYAWSRDSRHVAVALGDGATRQFVSGVSLLDEASPVTWPVIGTALANTTEVPLNYVRDLSWAPGDSFGFVGSDGQDDPLQTVFVAQAGLAAPPTSAPYYDAELRLRQTPTGWVVFDAFNYTATGIVPPNGVALHSVAWPSPSGEFVASVHDGQLWIYAMDDPLAALATSEPGSCAVVAAWAPRANGIERIVCSGGSLDAPDGTAVRVFDFDVGRRVFDPPAGRAVPLNGAFSPAPLTNTRRFFAPSADWLVLGAPEQGVTLLPVPSGSPELPRPTKILSVTAPAELRFSQDGRSLLVYDRDGLLWSPVPPSPLQSTLSLDGAGRRMAPPRLGTCEEAVWASPDNFVISGDSKSVLFEADGALWVADLGLAHDRPARRVAPLVSACGPSCVAATYGFAP
jgi:hypothetical protein